MADELPDWLVEMRDQQLGDQLGPVERDTSSEQESVEGLMAGVERQVALPEEAFQEPLEQVGEGDILEGLREQMAQVEEEFEDEDKPSLTRLFSGLEPWQRFVLAVLVFLDVGLCGCMALVMAGRVMLPF